MQVVAEPIQAGNDHGCMAASAMQASSFGEQGVPVATVVAGTREDVRYSPAMAQLGWPAA